ncbi:MAG: hypothetical protein GXP30_13410 [Verrucomicrobia bacterium]|nr:hypothetical protein [Verrucomicrobiota bacterium]
MRIVLSQKGWVFDGLSGLEWLFLQRLPVLVNELSADEGALLRLYPDPIRESEEEAREGSGVDEDENESVVADWKNYVRPELETLFDEARRVVATDLERAQQFQEEGSVDEGEAGEQVFYSLEVSGEHVEQWNSTLNQARLLMNEVYDLADSERRLAEGLMEVSADAEEPGVGEDRSRQAQAYPKWLLLAQYGFYGAVQSFLIDTLMDV